VAENTYPYLLKHNSGSCSEFVRCSEEHIALKLPRLSFEEAASIPLAAMTAHQALRLYRGDLSGKIVFVPAGC
jgi:NADPH:quinone reductase-like Zn-dependent oxidoreductase